MGVWISGFFGSGKSHFLKILSYLLANKDVNGKRAIDYFLDDNKISDPMVLADMKLASTVPTDVVLFNIDSKSEVNGKQSKVAIVSVLQNVFNEMQGFSGSNPFLADLERKLTDEGKYDLFKEKFEDSFGTDWIEARNDFDFIQDDVVEVLAFKTHAEHVFLAELQALLYVFHHFGGSSGRKGEDGDIGQLFADVGNGKVGGTEVVAPLGYAVALVDGDEAHLHTVQLGEDDVGGEALRGDVEELVSAKDAVVERCHDIVAAHA